VRGVKCGGREAGRSMLIVCWRVSFKVVHGFEVVRRTFRGRSSPSAVEFERSCGVAGRGYRRAMERGSAGSVRRGLEHAV
jgi:hypothetical protein